MKTFSSVGLASVVLSVLTATFAIGCGGAPQDSAGASDDALSAAASGAARYAAIAGTWTALDDVPASSDDGAPSFTTYVFDAKGTFTASRACPSTGVAACKSVTTETGSWKIFTSVPNLPSVQLTWSGGSEAYTFSMQNDLLVLDGIDSLFQHEVSALPTVDQGSVCEDSFRNSMAQCADAVDCDHETHRCQQGS